METFQDQDGAITYACKGSRCQFKTSNGAKMMNHQTLCHNERVIPCMKCNGLLFLAADIPTHNYQVHGPTEFECCFCDQMCRDVAFFNHHLKLMHANLVGKVVLEDLVYTTPSNEERIHRVRSIVEYLNITSKEEVIQIDEGFFQIGFCEKRKMPLYTVEVLDRDMIVSDVPLTDRHFTQEEKIDVMNQLNPSAIRYIGLQVGHLAAAANYIFLRYAFERTNTMMNCVPMNATVNQSVWETKEGYVRSLLPYLRYAIVINGPIFDEDGENVTTSRQGLIDVDVPVAFFSIVILDHGSTRSMQCFLIPNQPEWKNLFCYTSTIEDVLRLAGLKIDGVQGIPFTWNLKTHAFRCNKVGCREAFSSFEMKCQHDIDVHGCSYKCNECPCVFKEQFQLRSHQRNLHGKIHVCEECGKKFRRKSEYNRHMAGHSSERILKCTVQGCTTDFAGKRKGNLDRHIYSCHERPGLAFRCDLCKVGFMENSEFMAHLDYHKASDTACFRCSFCLEEYKSVKELIQHKNEEHLKFVCPSCGQRFLWESQLKDHQDHHGTERKYKCTNPGCTAAFKTSRGLRDHMKNICNRPVLKCHKCGKVYRIKTMYDNHLKKCKKFQRPGSQTSKK